MSVKSKYLSTVCLTVILLGLSGCYVNTKPDHPQVRESFSERRNPRDNQLASSGALAEQDSSGAFKPISKVNIDGAATPKEKKGIITNFLGNNAKENEASSTNTENEDFFSRLYSRLFAANDEAFKVAEERYQPIDNHIHLTSQGSTDSSYSYYEMSDELDSSEQFVVAQATPPSIPVPPPSMVPAAPQPAPVVVTPPAAPIVEAQPQTVTPQQMPVEKKADLAPAHVEYGTTKDPAKVTEKAMVDVPTVPSADDMKAKAEAKETKPEFKDIPSTETVKTTVTETQKEEVKPSEVAKPEVTKPVKKHKKKIKKKTNYSDTKYKDPITSVSPEEYRPQDPNASIQIMNGKHVFTGSLGDLKHCDKNNDHMSDDHNY